MIELTTEGGVFYILELGELDTNVLRIVVVEAGPQGAVRDVEGTGIHARPISPLPDVTPYELIWPSYLTFLVVDEIFDDGLDAGDQEIALFEHEESPLLDYFRLRMPRGFDGEEPVRHWRLLCEDHTVDVLSTEAPTIRALDRAVVDTSPREFSSWQRTL